LNNSVSQTMYLGGGKYLIINTTANIDVGQYHSQYIKLFSTILAVVFMIKC